MNKTSVSCGFSLLEVMLTIILFSVLLAIAVPQYHIRIMTEEIKNAASETEGIILHAKSLALSAGEPLWLDILRTETADQSPRWRVILHHNRHFLPQDVIQEVSGDFYPDVVLSSGLITPQIRIDHLTGRPEANGSLQLFLRRSPEKIVKILISYGAGRVRTCSAGEAYYGFPAC
ncbi:hypothetical protein VA7868_02228 [Vibrio aerogenes CECT 7868]|uniref:Uncharacterized protein n=1 Tax=Vibrio aerogenes CECT 7868 TaxID=1216006 RepID=A0A1M5Z3P2_9VIBR|nr:prepilin-type N-terminal cleavage/methylation domain-containing protein [Vibrio aerogenes]SHI18523.1 hypothetical protein VA7868_02228 [Vibrio aerogenes CECT 7868]